METGDIAWEEDTVEKKGSKKLEGREEKGKVKKGGEKKKRQEFLAPEYKPSRSPMSTGT